MLKRSNAFAINLRHPFHFPCDDNQARSPTSLDIGTEHGIELTGQLHEEAHASERVGFAKERPGVAKAGYIPPDRVLRQALRDVNITQAGRIFVADGGWILKIHGVDTAGHADVGVGAVAGHVRTYRGWL